MKTGKVIVKIDPRYFRPAEVECVQFIFASYLVIYSFQRFLWGNPAKAEKQLGWKRKVDFDSLVKEMVAADLKAAGSLIEDQN